MADDNRLIECPSCGHLNALYVDKCIICEYSLGRYIAELRQQEPIAPLNKKLGPLPESDLLIDKQKSRRAAIQNLQCDKCGEMNRIGSLICHNCGTRLEPEPLAPTSPAEPYIEPYLEDEEIEPHYAPVEDEYETQDVPKLDLAHNHATERPAMMVQNTLDDPIEEIPAGCHKFTSWMILRFDIMGNSTPLVIRPIEDKPLMIGRRHESLPVQPQVDLTPYLMNRHGVSRRHALLRLRGTRLELQDLNSTNGTSINGIRFSPRESHQVRHQDIIRIGQILMQITFIQQVKSAKYGYTDELH